MRNLFYLCVEGDVNKTYEYLNGLKDKTKEQAEIEKKYYSRFYQYNPDYKVSHADKWIENVINEYRYYFVEVLTKKVERSAAGANLLKRLNCYLPKDKKGTNMKGTEENLKTIFNEKGLYFIGGKVEPHYGPFIWKTTDKKTYHVDIPDTREMVQVCFLDDFLMLSWLHFATFGKVYAGGWAKEDALYCILPNYRDKLDTDVFLVSFLKHEAQHYSDYKQFPKLKGHDLEYRAKLVELIYYSDYEFMKKLLIEAVNNSNPHNYAAFIILKRLSKHFFSTDAEKRIEKWTEINYDKIRSFARKLFNEHTSMLQSQDVHTVESVI
ncbi:hypothetical protein CFK37_19290 [Virgibacillus phasianinus]|uniref:Uncharacterized protein n=1 Tax=Virgibacillus phasianinus TaxID=2017483 RepID=A0A220U8T1_9BACI|nr:hypothetical protein [Virgibacillus phasianinus]ASK64143.1 hypothetical protein CFK37_19290 [Virgibacillus phasianinus]